MAAAQSQNPPRPLVSQAVDESKSVMLRGTVHPLAQARFDQGAVPGSFAANRMLLMLNRSPEQEAALRQFLNDVHTPGSTGYHQWVTPAQFGELFGPADADIQAATSWLASHGFQVAKVTAGKNFIEFSRTAANVREAFHAQIHRYSVDNETHYANSTELAIPEALAPLVRGVSPMNNFRARSALRSAGRASYSRTTRKATPLFTIPTGGSSDIFAIAPEDFATQYNLGPVYAAGTNGSGETIGIIGESNIDPTLVNAYRQIFGLSINPTQIVID
jgi:subtilase family serine protease